MNELTTSNSEIDTRSVTIETAKPGDAEAINNLLRETWLDTYVNEGAGITEKAIRLRLSGAHGEHIAQRVQRWKDTIEHIDDTKCVYVARLDGKVVGLAVPRITEGRRHVGALYVLPQVQGLGIGAKLMRKCLEWHGDAEDIYLNVASYNQKAIDFYEHFGFEKTDSVVEDAGDVHENIRIPELEMIRKASTQ